jgi:hypothetical protein
MAEQINAVNLDFYGFTLQLRSDDSQIVKGIQQDFSYFKKENGSPGVVIEVFDKKPPYSTLPNIPASIHGLNYVVYHHKGKTYTDFHGQGLRISSTNSSYSEIYAADRDHRHEISYLTILSLVGQYLDSKHIHRVHALGVSRNNKAVLILLPETGGKTTLALKLLRSGQVKLLSEDSPLLNRHSEIIPFPLRLGILPGGEKDIPEQYLYPVKLMRVGTKIMVNLEYFQDGIGSKCPLHAILIGKRSLGTGSAIIRTSRFNALNELFKNSVVGMGLHQGMEYLLGRNILQTMGRSSIAFSRLNNSLGAISRCKTYKYTIGHDFERNAQVLLEFMEKNI